MTKMQKMILAAAVMSGFSGFVSAQVSPCAAYTSASTYSIQPSATGELGFIQVQFNLNCSSNVHLTYDETATSATAASASRKGNAYFFGDTNGGSVTAGTDLTSSNGWSGCTTDASARTGTCTPIN